MKAARMDDHSDALITLAALIGITAGAALTWGWPAAVFAGGCAVLVHAAVRGLCGAMLASAALTRSRP